MNRSSTAVIAAVMTAGFMLSACTPADMPAELTNGTSSPDTPPATSMLKNFPPCANEDGPGPCFWDAGAAGNGVGNSFWVDCHQVGHYLNPVVDAREGGDMWAPNGYADACGSAS